jgi:superfamily II DNA/RNA helicase
MVFTRTKRSADRIAGDLSERGFAAAAVHGDLGQGARERALRAFRSGKIDILVATDVAARGIDIVGVTHVINYECPDDEKAYLHRIGRTGRAGETGSAITFVDWEDIYRWGMINKALDLPFPEPEETYSTSEVLYEELDIPREATGRLPRSKRTREGLEAEQIEDIGETGRKRPPSDRPAQSSRSRQSSRSESGGSAATRTPRQRRRTRGGVAPDGTPAESAAAAPAPRASSGEQQDDGGPATSKPRRRRRSRGGRSGSGTGAAGTPRTAPAPDGGAAATGS